MLTNLLEVAGVLLLAAFAYFLWPPAALAVLGAAALLIASRRAARAL